VAGRDAGYHGRRLLRLPQRRQVPHERVVPQLREREACRLFLGRATSVPPDDASINLASS
jgi:hypothetical protein